MRSLVLGVFTVLLSLLALAFTLAQPSSAGDAVPSLVSFGGTLRESSGAPMSKITGVTFAIYNSQTGGAPLWLETQNVTPDASGHYTVQLGSTKSGGIPADLFSQNEERWLGVQVQGQPEQARILLVSVPYAMKAAEADRLAGHDAAEFVTTETLRSAVQQQLQQQALALPSASTSKTPALTADLSPNLATNFSDTTTNQVVLVTQNGTGVALSAAAPSNSSIIGATNASAVAGVVAGVEGVSGVSSLSYGVYGRTTAATATRSVGAYGQSDAVSGIGAEGNALGTGSTIGVLGQSNSTSGVGVSAVETATSGSTYGIASRIFSPTGGGLWLLNSASGTITGPLIRAQTNAGTQFQVGGNGNVTAVGTIAGTRLISTVATGTAPLQVASTTLVPNLNASLLGGSPASSFAPAIGSPSYAPSTGAANYIQNTTTQQTGDFNVSGNGTVGGTVTAANFSGNGSGLTNVNAATAVTATAISNRIATLQWWTQSVFSFPSNPRSLAFDGTNLWVGGISSLSKIQPSDGAVLGNYAVLKAYGLAYDGANLWVTDNADSTVQKVRASDGTTLGTFPVGAGPVGVAFDGSNVWVADFGDNTVTELRASDGALQNSISVGRLPYGIAFDGTNIWVTNSTDGTVTVLLASTGALVNTYAVGASPRGLAFDGTNIWIANANDNTVSKLLASSGALLGTYPAGSTPYGVAFDGTNIWVVNFPGGVTKLRASDGALLATYSLTGAGNSTGIAFDGANIWATSFGAKVTKIPVN